MLRDVSVTQSSDRGRCCSPCSGASVEQRRRRGVEGGRALLDQLVEAAPAAVRSPTPRVMLFMALRRQKGSSSIRDSLRRRGHQKVMGCRFSRHALVPTSWRRPTTLQRAGVGGAITPPPRLTAFDAP